MSLFRPLFAQPTPYLITYQWLFYFDQKRVGAFIKISPQNDGIALMVKVFNPRLEKFFTQIFTQLFALTICANMRHTLAHTDTFAHTDTLAHTRTQFLMPYTHAHTHREIKTIPFTIGFFYMIFLKMLKQLQLFTPTITFNFWRTLQHCILVHSSDFS